MALLSALPITLSFRQESLLRGYRSRRNIQYHYFKRISIILDSHEGLSNNKIKSKYKMALNTVRKWRSEWHYSQEALSSFEAGLNGAPPSDSELLSFMLDILSDAPRPGAPPVISEEQKKSLIALACENPEDYGLPVSSWTHELLATTMVELNLVESISSSYVGIILKKSGHTTS